MRFRAGDALVRSEQQYRTLAHNIPGIVFRLSLTDSVMEYFNDHLEAVTGYTIQELTSGKFSSLIPLIYAEDKEQVIQEKAKAITTGESYDIKYRIIDKKGNIRFMSEWGCPIIDDSGTVVGIDGIIQDIS